MSRTTFYNDNRNRRYPFISTDPVEQLSGVELPNSVVLDAGFQLLAYSGYNPQQHSVWLSQVAVSGPDLVLTCATDAPGFVGKTLVFSVPLTPQPETQSIFAECSGQEVGANPDDATAHLLWYGFLVLGSLSDATDWLGSHSGTLVAGKHTFEPTLVQNLDGGYVRSVNLANRQRVRTTDVEGATRPYITYVRALTGALQFRAGYNCQLGYATTGTGLTIGAALGAGAGEPCDEVLQFPSETSPDGGFLLSGGPRCRDTIRFINGVPGPFIELSGGAGISILQNPADPNNLSVGTTTSKLQTCTAGGVP